MSRCNLPDYLHHIFNEYSGWIVVLFLHGLIYKQNIYFNISVWKSSSDMIFHFTVSSCQVLDQCDIDISSRFNTSLLVHYSSSHDIHKHKDWQSHSSMQRREPSCYSSCIHTGSVSLVPGHHEPTSHPLQWNHSVSRYTSHCLLVSTSVLQPSNVYNTIGTVRENR